MQPSQQYTAGQPVDGGREIDERVAECRSLHTLFAVLARCLEEEVDADLLGALRGALRPILHQAQLPADDALFVADEPQVLAQLAEEYAGLFIAPGGVSPHASVFETGCMYREPADRAAAAYAQAGYRFERRLSGEFADHIGTMLGFYAARYLAEAEQLERADLEGAQQIRVEREAFLVEQLASWAPGWCVRAARAALQPFYGRLLVFTERALWAEIATCVDRRKLREIVTLNRRTPPKLDYDADFRKASGL